MTKFISLDFEYADVILPSICSVSIVQWNDNKIENVYYQLINPECEIEEFLCDRHGITNNFVKNAPNIREIWKDLYDMLDGQLVVTHYAKRNIDALKKLTSINYLNLPSFQYICTASMCRRLYGYLKTDRLYEITEYLDISDKHFNAKEDAISVGKLFMQGMKDTGSSDIQSFVEDYKVVHGAFS